MMSSLFHPSLHTGIGRYRVTISVEWGLLKGDERRVSTIFKKVAKVPKKRKFVERLP
jgi:hypothetical protein